MEKKKTLILMLNIAWLIYQIYFFGNDSPFELLSRNLCSYLGLVDYMEIIRGRTVCAYMASLAPVLYMYFISIYFSKKNFYLPWIVGIVLFVFSTFITRIPILFVVNLGVLIIGFIVFFLFEFQNKEGTKSTKSMAWICTCIVLAILVNIVEICLLSILNYYSPENVSSLTNWLSAYSPLVMGNIAMVILAPLFEELAFRGCVFTQLDDAFSTLFAIIISSLFWGVWHRNIGQFVYIFPFGLLQAWVYKKTGKLRYPILIHACSNFVANIAFLQGTIFNGFLVWFFSCSVFMCTIIALISISASILLIWKQR